LTSHTIENGRNFESKETMPHRAEAKILVVDDDAPTRKVLMRMLTTTGYECRECESGADAWERVRSKQPPALLLLDLDMPGVNGAQLLKRMRSDPDPTIAHMPAIMLTGHGGQESEVLCLEAGADDFVIKPINAAVLRARIDTQLRLQFLRRQLQQKNEELESWRRNLERDLEAARLTQQSLIPHKPPKLPGWDVAACFRPVIQVGGDIYGWLRMKDGRFLFWIADATGHGASAALITTLTKLLFHHGTGEHDAPANIMQAVNNDFRSIFGARSFMTAMCVALESDTGKATVVGAGHPPLLISRRKGGVDLIASSAPPLGLIESPKFVETPVNIGKEETFILYTDGLFGSGDGKKTRLTPELLAQTVDRTAPTAEMLLARMLNQIAPSDGIAHLPDDMAAVAVRRMGEKNFLFR
jgi:sigma-B regulation protein RsbU (phosphoserine phosphatase)